MNDEIIDQIAERVEEKIRYRIIRSIIEALEEEFYPPEDLFSDEFVKEVELAEKEVKEGKSRIYSIEDFRKEFI
ncbi:MAG: hypothetical protein QXV61_01625 [Archaeoglobaceae archaeon]